MKDDESVMKGFGAFSGKAGEAFATGVEEVRERMDRDFKRRADALFEE